MEIERKYLLTPEGLSRFMLDTYPALRIEQSYLSVDPVIRLRRMNGGASANTSDRYVLTVKGPGSVQREEFELELNAEQYTNLLTKAEGQMIMKTRVLIPLSDGHTAEADVYHGHLAGLLTVEVEFSDEDDMRTFTPPAWFGHDVSEDRAYKNSALAMRGMPGTYDAS